MTPRPQAHQPGRDCPGWPLCGADAAQLRAARKEWLTIAGEHRDDPVAPQLRLVADLISAELVERGDTSVWCSHCQRYESEASGLCMMCEQGVPHEGADGRRYPTPALRRPAGREGQAATRRHGTLPAPPDLSL